MYYKYVRRGGVLCGPYAYTSKRIGHSVKSVYLGKVNTDKKSASPLDKDLRDFARKIDESKQFLQDRETDYRKIKYVPREFHEQRLRGVIDAHSASPMRSEGRAMVSTPEGKVYIGDTLEDAHLDVMRKHNLPQSGDAYNEQLRSWYNPKTDRIVIAAPAKELQTQELFNRQLQSHLKAYEKEGILPDTPMLDLEGRDIGALGKPRLVHQDYHSIVVRDGQWVVMDKDKTRILGRHGTAKGAAGKRNYKKALKQLQAIEISKRMRHSISPEEREALRSLPKEKRQELVERALDTALDRKIKEGKFKGVGFSVESDYKKAQPTEDVPKGDYVAQEKLDGIRAKIFGGKTLRFMNRNGVNKAKQYPELQTIKLPKGTVVDGEIVALNKKGYDDFKLISERDHLKYEKDIQAGVETTPVTFMAFDVLRYKGKDVRKLPWIERNKILHSLKESEHFKILKSYPKSKAKELMADKNVEGVVFKQKESVYDDTRNKNWLKLKQHQAADVVITGYEEGKGKRKGAVGALNIGVWDKKTKKIKSLGKVGTGFGDKEAKDLKKRLDKGERLFAKVGYLHVGSKGNLRHPVFEGLREDVTLQGTNYSAKPSEDWHAPKKIPKWRKLRPAMEEEDPWKTHSAKPHKPNKQELLAQRVETKLRPFVSRIQVAGSIRRGEAKHKDIDIVAIPKDKDKIRAQLKTLGGKKVVDGEEKLSYRINGTNVEVYFAKPEDWGGMLTYATGSRGHTIGFRKKAKELGYRMDQHGVWKGKKLIAGRTERDIWKVLERPRFKQPWERYSAMTREERQHAQLKEALKDGGVPEHVRVSWIAGEASKAGAIRRHSASPKKPETDSFEHINREKYLALKRQIEGMTNYGRRQNPIPLEKKQYAFSWSNGAKKWFGGLVRQKHMVKDLDANEFTVPGNLFKNEAEVKKMAEVLPPLPLYFASFEAGERQEVSIPQKYAIWAKAKGLPEVDVLRFQGLAKDVPLAIPDMRGELEKSSKERPIVIPPKEELEKGTNHSVKRPQAIGSKWTGDKYIHGPRKRQPKDFKTMITVDATDKRYKALAPGKLPKGSKLIVGPLKKTGKWALQSTLTPRKGNVKHSAEPAKEEDYFEMAQLPLAERLQERINIAESHEADVKKYLPRVMPRSHFLTPAQGTAVYSNDFSNLKDRKIHHELKEEHRDFLKGLLSDANYVQPGFLKQLEKDKTDIVFAEKLPARASVYTEKGRTQLLYVTPKADPIALAHEYGHMKDPRLSGTIKYTGGGWAKVEIPGGKPGEKYVVPLGAERDAEMHTVTLANKRALSTSDVPLPVMHQRYERAGNVLNYPVSRKQASKALDEEARVYYKQTKEREQNIRAGMSKFSVKKPKRVV